MTRESFPEIPQDALKSHAPAERVERVWRRLALDMAEPPRPRPRAYWWAPVAVASIFGLGVWVGARTHTPAADVAAVAEPRPALPAAGAGRAAEREAPVAARRDTPARKRTRAPRGLPTGEVVVEPYADGYAEPALAAPEPAQVVDFAEWEKLAEAGDFRAAKLALDREGGFARAASRASAGQLMVLADIARASGSREQAAEALRRVLSAYVSAPEAPVAAWTLGNLLEQAGDKSGAAEAYATYRRLSPTGDFAEDAAARQVDAALSQGNLELGRRVMEGYAQNFPKGRRLAELRKRLASLEAPAVETTSAAPSEPEDEDDASDPSADAVAAPPVVGH